MTETTTTSKYPLPVPVGWINLEKHLVRHHNLDWDEVGTHDSQSLRRLHRRLHRLGLFRPGLWHFHEEELVG